MFKASRQPSLTTGTNPVENSFLSRGEVYIVGILHPVEPANLQSLQARESFGKVVRVSSKLRASLLQRGHRGFCRFQQGGQVELVGSSCRPHLGPSLPGVSAIFWALGFRLRTFQFQGRGLQALKVTASAMPGPKGPEPRDAGDSSIPTVAHPRARGIQLPK